MDQTYNNHYFFAGFTLDVSRRQLLSPEGQAVTLSVRAFDTLLALIRSKGEVVSKAELMESVWPGLVVEDNNVSQAIFSLRKALADSRSDSRIIRTVPGKGYSFVAPLEKLPQEPTSNSGSSETVAHSQAAPAQSQNTPGEARHGLFWWSWHPALGLISLLLAILGLASMVFVYLDRQPGAAALSAEARSVQTAVEEQQARPPALLRNSIAVFPFSIVNARDPDSEFFALGLNDELVNQLASIRSLNIIARRSTQILLEQGLSIEEIAQRIGVESVLTGTVMFLNERARVSLQLLDPRKGVTLWADSYNTDVADIAELVAVQRDIALNAARALEAGVDKQEEIALGELPTASFAAYRYNLAARHAYYSGDFKKAWDLGKQSMLLDGNYYDALYNFASVNTVLLGASLPGMTAQDHRVLAMDTANRMIKLAPGRTEGYALKAAIHSTNREWHAVRQEMDHLERLEATLADQRFLGSVLLSLGDFEGAIAILEANLQVEPVDLYARGFLMMAHEMVGNRFRSRQEYALGEELSSVWWGDNVNIFLAMGRDESLSDVADVRGISPQLSAMLHKLNEGRGDELRTSLHELADNGGPARPEALYYSAIAAQLGDHELSLALLSHAVQDVWLRIHWVWLPVFDEVRKLAGFRELLRESGLVAYWQTYGWPEMCRPEGDTFHCDWTAYP